MLIKELLGESAAHEKYIRMMLSRVLNKQLTDKQWVEWKNEVRQDVSPLIHVHPKGLTQLLELKPSLLRHMTLAGIQYTNEGFNVKGDVRWNVEGLTSLPIKFNKVSGDFICGVNNLETLEGAPKTVGGHFNCSNSVLETLKGAPEYVGGDFRCHVNKLKTLEGAPELVGGHFYCGMNNLETLEGAPKSVGANFICPHQENGKVFTEEEVRAVCDVNGAVLC